MARYGQLALAQAVINENCRTEGYTRLMAQIDSDKSPDKHASKKFVAAALCFTDYDTGKTLDINSLRPVTDSSANLTAHP